MFSDFTDPTQGPLADSLHALPSSTAPAMAPTRVFAATARPPGTGARPSWTSTSSVTRP
jgi:hypothetical protein